MHTYLAKYLAKMVRLLKNINNDEVLKSRP